MSCVLMFTSGKGGVGKTTLAANLAFGIALQNKKIIILDLDLGLRNLDILMGVEHKVVYDIADVINGTCRLRQAIIRDSKNPNLYFLPGTLQQENSLSSSGVQTIIEQLKYDFDYIIIDGPAGMDYGFQLGVHLADEIILVVNPEMCSIRDASQMKHHILSRYNAKIRLIVNRTRRFAFQKRHYIQTRDIEEMLMLPVYGEVPNDERLISFINKGEFFANKNIPISRAIIQLSNKIVLNNGEE